MQIVITLLALLVMVFNSSQALSQDWDAINNKLREAGIKPAAVDWTSINVMCMGKKEKL